MCCLLDLQIVVLCHGHIEWIRIALSDQRGPSHWSLISCNQTLRCNMMVFCYQLAASLFPVYSGLWAQTKDHPVLPISVGVFMACCNEVHSGCCRFSVCLCFHWSCSTKFSWQINGQRSSGLHQHTDLNLVEVDQCSLQLAVGLGDWVEQWFPKCWM